ncbi:YolD-like family protein [Jeotgalibacillus campisalis]|uniref:YolD-like protein n=1 Tax=Jeotgalibacillus campisalis TaxID=220754 RepID=A0A0C2VNW6_9BACL|nr:YolD-like family protein [Jeotgalibacillus campisalis]KIL46141.1 hypothetical protein KR50_28160 [Jeotgalibacillus campisalis]
MNRDRGDIKWASAMMLPELAKGLAEAKAEYNRIEKPVLDEQMLMEFEFTINQAIQHNLLLKVDYFINGQIQSVEGYVLYIDYHSRKYRFETKNGDPYEFSNNDLVAVNALQEHITFDE